MIWGDLQNYKEINNPINQLIHPNHGSDIIPAIAEWLLKKH